MPVEMLLQPGNPTQKHAASRQLQLASWDPTERYQSSGSSVSGTTEVTITGSPCLCPLQADFPQLQIV